MRTWRDQLEEARALRKKGAALTYQRAVKLREVYCSDGFMEHCKELGRSKHEVLNDEVADLCCTAKVLFAVLDTFPKVADWKHQRLDILAAKAIEATKMQSEERKASTERISWKDRYLELELRYDELLQKYDSLRSHFPEQVGAKAK